MTVINFEVIKYKEKVKGICVKCGKKKQRMIKAEQTVNPFNKDEAGNPKNKFEVQKSTLDEMLKRRDRFIKEGFICSTCKEYLGY